MGQNRQYDQEYKVQAVKLAKEIGVQKAALDLDIPYKTLYRFDKHRRSLVRTHCVNCQNHFHHLFITALFYHIPGHLGILLPF